MQRTNYFIEGLQGAGKSTFVQRLSEHLTDYEVFHEGDYSPVELAWCAYVTEEQYQGILRQYSSIREEIKNSRRRREENYLLHTDLNGCPGLP